VAVAVVAEEAMVEAMVGWAVVDSVVAMVVAGWAAVDSVVAMAAAMAVVGLAEGETAVD
jgi:hypothetical protein